MSSHSEKTCLAAVVIWLCPAAGWSLVVSTVGADLAFFWSFFFATLTFALGCLATPVSLVTADLAFFLGFFFATLTFALGLFLLLGHVLVAGGGRLGSILLADLDFRLGLFGLLGHVVGGGGSTVVCRGWPLHAEGLLSLCRFFSVVSGDASGITGVHSSPTSLA